MTIEKPWLNKQKIIDHSNYKFVNFSTSKFYFLFALIHVLNVSCEEMIFGEEIIYPGIKITFEAAPKDIIYPIENYLAESNTDIHIEMLINWHKESPQGSPVGGFIPYLNVTATIKNKNGDLITTQLTPHINITDNFHYAQNIKLPGDLSDMYDVSVKISPPSSNDLGIHFDWKEKYEYLLLEKVFNYQDLYFGDIALKSRR